MIIKCLISDEDMLVKACSKLKMKVMQNIKQEALELLNVLQLSAHYINIMNEKC